MMKKEKKSRKIKAQTHSEGESPDSSANLKFDFYGGEYFISEQRPPARDTQNHKATKPKMYYS